MATDFKEHPGGIICKDHRRGNVDGYTCEHYEQGLTCTRPRGHSGRCEAGTSDKIAYASWLK